MKMKHTLWLSMAYVLCLWAGQAQADSITIFNTGVDASGTVLADGTIGDPHYTLISVPDGTTDIRIRSSDGGFPIPPYLGDNTFSRWIGPNNDSSLNGPGGTYHYQTTFDLSGFNPSTAVLTGNWSTDNDGLNIIINGTSLGFTTAVDSFGGFSPFTVSSGFVGGLNTLAFEVNNFSGDPTALRVEMSGTAATVPGPSTVPEPSTLLLLGSTLVGLAAWRWKRVG